MSQSMTPKVKPELRPSPYDEAMNLALKFLGPRARSKSEVRDKLELVQTPEATIEEVLHRLEELALVNDAELATDMAERARSRGESASRVRSGLKFRGLSELPGLVDSSGEEERDRALKLAITRARALRNLPPQVAQRRLAAYLGRRGYNYDIVKEVCRKALSDEDFDD